MFLIVFLLHSQLLSYIFILWNISSVSESAYDELPCWLHYCRLQINQLFIHLPHPPPLSSLEAFLEDRACGWSPIQLRFEKMIRPDMFVWELNMLSSTQWHALEEYCTVCRHAESIMVLYESVRAHPVGRSWVFWSGFTFSCQILT